MKKKLGLVLIGFIFGLVVDMMFKREVSQPHVLSIDSLRTVNELSTQRESKLMHKLFETQKKLDSAASLTQQQIDKVKDLKNELNKARKNPVIIHDLDSFFNARYPCPDCIHRKMESGKDSTGTNRKGRVREANDSTGQLNTSPIHTVGNEKRSNRNPKENLTREDNSSGGPSIHYRESGFEDQRTLEGGNTTETKIPLKHYRLWRNYRYIYMEINLT